MSGMDTHTPDLFNEVARLASACLADEASADELARLNQLLETQPEARQIFLQFVHDSQSLRTWASQGGAAAEGAAASHGTAIPLPHEAPQTVSVSPRTRSASGSGWRGLMRDFAREPVLLAIVVVSMVSACILAYSFSTHRKSGSPAVVHHPPAEKAKVDAPVPQPALPAAMVTRTVSPQWEPANAPQENRIAKGQRLKLARGLVQITFQSQATALVEGPAELEISGNNECKLSLGKLLANVPASAQGFVVETPTLKIVDLGTEFGVEVRGEGLGVRSQGSGIGSEKSEPLAPNPQPLAPSTEVHVLTGRVDVLPLQSADAADEHVAQQAPIELKAGEAVRTSAESPELKPTPADPGKFVREMPAPLPEPPPWPKDSPLKPGDIVAVSNAPSKLHLFKIDPRTGEQKLLATGVRYREGLADDHGLEWSCVAVEPDGNILVAAKGLGAWDAGLLRINPRSGEIKVVTRGGLLKAESITGLAVAGDGTIYAAYNGAGYGEPDYVLKIDPATGKLTQLARFASDISGLCFDVDGRVLLTASSKDTQLGRVQLTPEPKLTASVYDHALGQFDCVTVSPQGRVFVGVTEVKPGAEGISLHQAKILEVEGPFPQQSGPAQQPVKTVAVTPRRPPPWFRMSMACEADGNLIFGAGSDLRHVYRVDTGTGKLMELSTGGFIEVATLLAIVPGKPAVATKEDK